MRWPQKNGIAIVGVSETMPAADRTYQQWQLSQFTALFNALQHATATTVPTHERPSAAMVELREAAVQLGTRTLWSELTFTSTPGSSWPCSGRTGWARPPC